MLIPSKYENLNKNLLVIGYEVLSKLKVRPYNVEDLYQILKKEKDISMEQYYNSITFLWLSDILIQNNYSLSIKKKNDLK